MKSAKKDPNLTPTFRCTAPAGNEIELNASYRLNMKDTTPWTVVLIVALGIVFLIITARPMNVPGVWQTLYQSTQSYALCDSSNSWLFDLILFKTWETAGFEGLILLHGLIAVGTFVLIYKAIRQSFRSPRVAALITAVVGLIWTPLWWTFTPLTFDALFLAAALYAMITMRVKALPILWQGPLFILWSNLDLCSAVIGLTFLIACAIIEKSPKRGQYWLAFAAAGIGTLINPDTLSLPSLAEQSTNFIVMAVLVLSMLILMYIIIPVFKVYQPAIQPAKQPAKPEKKTEKSVKSTKDNNDNEDNDYEDDEDEEDNVSPASVIPFCLFLSISLIFLITMLSGPIQGLCIKPRSLDAQLGTDLPTQMTDWLNANHVRGTFTSTEPQWPEFIQFQTRGRMTPVTDEPDFLIGYQDRLTGDSQTAPWKTISILRSDKHAPYMILMRNVL